LPAVEIYANQPSTTVSSGGTDAPVSGTQETWTVAASSTFPAASSTVSPATQFHVADTAYSYTSEIVAVTNVSGSTWTVTRGAESTTPVAHASGFTVTQVVTAGALVSLGGLPGAPWVTLPYNWYAGPWFTGQPNLSSTPMWVLFDGDSVTNGANTTSGAGFLAVGWPDQLRASILASLGAGVYGDYYPMWSYTTGTSGAQDPQNEGFGVLLTAETDCEGGFGTCFNQNSSNAWFQTVTTASIPGWTSASVTGFDLVYYDYGVCTWEFTIDGGQGGSPTVSGATWTGSAWQVTNSGGGRAAGNVKKVTVRGLSAASHVIEYGQVSTGGDNMVLGISLFTGSTGGAGFVRSAYSGRRSVDSAAPSGANVAYSGLNTFPDDRPALWSGYGPTDASAQITPTPFGFPAQPTLAFICYGINDAACSINPEATRDAIWRKIIAIRRGVPNANIGIVAMCYPDIHNSDNALNGNGDHYARWKKVLQTLAADYDCAYIDIDAKWGGTPVGQGFMTSGNVHPTSAGHADIASVIAGII